MSVVVKTICFAGAIACGTATSASVTAGPLDLAGKDHAGALFAFSNTLAAIPGIVGVRLGKHMETGVMACIVLKCFATVIYSKFGSATRII